MKMYSLRELLKQYLEFGFDIVSVSMVTQISEDELLQLCSNENYKLTDKDKERRLMVFLLQLCCERPENDRYYRVLLESLIQYFKVSPEAIANYIGVETDVLLSFEGSRDKDRIEKCIAHLFTTFIRDLRYSE